MLNENAPFKSISDCGATVVTLRRPQELLESGKSNASSKGTWIERFCTRNTLRTNVFFSGDVYQPSRRSDFSLSFGWLALTSSGSAGHTAGPPSTGNSL